MKTEILIRLGLERGERSQNRKRTELKNDVSKKCLLKKIVSSYSTEETSFTLTALCQDLREVVSVHQSEFKDGYMLVVKRWIPNSR